ncbi:MAG: MarR family transcriptional regulator [Clostridia bacterium]|nr:MarR family transcriptional regulator [Clostridia bacterium]
MKDNEIINVIRQMISVNRMHKRAIETVVDDIGIHRSKHQVLMKLAKRETVRSQKEIAEELGITQAAMTVSLSKLERDGLIARTTGKDNRYNEISITEKGREIVEKSREYFTVIDRKTLAGLTQEELSCLSVCFEKIQNNLKELTKKEEK